MNLIFSLITTSTAVVLLGGCVTEPVPRTASICPAGLTYACTSSVNQKRQCICATREELRDILDPVNDY